METNPSRNNRLRLIHTDEQPGVGVYSLLPVPVYSIGRKDRHASENSGKSRLPRNFSLTKQTVARLWGPGNPRTPGERIASVWPHRRACLERSRKVLADHFPPGAHNGGLKEERDRMSVQSVRYLPGSKCQVCDRSGPGTAPLPLTGSILSPHPEGTSVRVRPGCPTIAVPESPVSSFP